MKPRLGKGSDWMRAQNPKGLGKRLVRGRAQEKPGRNPRSRLANLKESSLLLKTKKIYGGLSGIAMQLLLDPALPLG